MSVLRLDFGKTSCEAQVAPADTKGVFGKVFRGLVAGTAFSLGAALALAPANSATLVTFQNGPDGGGIDRFEVTCTVACEGWLFDAEMLGGDIGGLIDKHDQNYATGTGEAWEKNLLASIVGATLTYVKDESGTTSFFSDALYHLFRIGKSPDVGLLVNTSGVAQSYAFSPFEGTGSGLSHVAEYGTVPPIPLPPAALLFLTGLAGMGLLTRRRRAKLGAAAA